MNEKLNELIKHAQGARTQNQFALNCGVSSAALTHVLKGINRPSPKFLKKIADHAHNGVTYEQLMNAAFMYPIEESNHEINEQIQTYSFDISKRLKELRTEQGLSQMQLAEASGISQSTIAKIEINRNEATASTIRKLAKFFNVSADYLLELDSAEYRTLSTPKNDMEMKVLEWFRALPSDAARREFVESLPIRVSIKKKK